MNWVDWGIVIVLTLSSVISLARGFIKESLSLVIWILALIIANIFSHHLEVLLSSAISTPSLRVIVAFALIFLGVLLVGALLNFLIGLVVKATGLSGTDRLFGMVFGFIRGALIVMICLIYVPNYVPITNDNWFKQSYLIPYFSPYQQAVKTGLNNISSWVINLLKPPEKVAL